MHPERDHLSRCRRPVARTVQCHTLSLQDKCKQTKKRDQLSNRKRKTTGKDNDQDTITAFPSAVPLARKPFGHRITTKSPTTTHRPPPRYSHGIYRDIAHSSPSHTLRILRAPECRTWAEQHGQGSVKTTQHRENRGGIHPRSFQEHLVPASRAITVECDDQLGNASAQRNLRRHQHLVSPQ